jgi:hypothetical protein
MRKIQLDRMGNSPIPDGYRLINNEIDFLKYAISDESLIIRGSRLCSWADIFYQGRRIQVFEVQSRICDIQDALPELTVEQAQAILDEIGEKISNLPRPITVPMLLRSLYPSSFWTDRPSSRHGAGWLLWLEESRPKEFIYPLLKWICLHWQNEIKGTETEIYKVFTPEQAYEFLRRWMCIIPDRDKFSLGEFPLPVPDRWIEYARLEWRRRLIEDGKDFFNGIISLPIPASLMKVAADETAKYFSKNSSQFTMSDYEILSLYLPWTNLDQLIKMVKPPEPPEPTGEAQDIIEWFCTKYLPYRLWQHANAVDYGHSVIKNVATHFALWYLRFYTKALSGGVGREYISFIKSSELASTKNNFVTLLVMLDGLHWVDAKTLSASLKNIADRLTLLDDNLVFSPIPTVTEFAKDAIFRGVQSVLANETDYIGEILPENETPLNRLKSASIGDLYLWRIQEPDRTYHYRNSSATLMQDVQAIIEGVAKKIQDLVARVPEKIPLQIIVTTDHGRMLGKAERVIHPPQNFESHGRTAWGESNKKFPEDGFEIRDEIAYLSKYGFGLNYDVIVPLDERAFLTKDNRKGKEIYPHGGLYPEEVIIPWLVFARDWARPNLEISISGTGDVDQQGDLLVEAINLNDVDLILTEIQLRYGDQSPVSMALDLAIGSNAKLETVVQLPKWPSSAEAKRIMGNVKVQYPNGLEFTVPAQISIESHEMYSQEDILEDLEL